MNQQFKTQYIKRIDTCKACPELMKAVSMCKRCGCFVPLKAALAFSACPLDKWAVEATEPK